MFPYTGWLYKHNRKKCKEYKIFPFCLTRLFDSQNNARGGYLVGPQPMYYYAGSKLQIEWFVYFYTPTT